MSKLLLVLVGLTLTLSTLALPSASAGPVPIWHSFCRVSTSGCVSAAGCGGQVVNTQCGVNADGSPRYCVPDGLGCCGCSVSL
jgi:hypothetical protein